MYWFESIDFMFNISNFANVQELTLIFIEWEVLPKIEKKKYIQVCVKCTTLKYKLL